MEVKHYNCPVCKMPDMAEREAANDLYLEILVAMVSGIEQKRVLCYSIAHC